MPVRVSDELPAIKFLKKENIHILKKTKDIFKIPSVLKILILNLMPKKIDSENQFLRLLAHSPLQIDVQLLRIDEHISKNTSIEHLNNFYCTFSDIQNQYFDGLIITGAPLGLIEFSNVTFWPKLKQLCNWAKQHITSILFICWSVQAALKILYNLPKFVRKKKLVGIYKHRITKSNSLLTQGFDEIFSVPHSRFSYFPKDLIYQDTDLEILAESDDAGVYLLISRNNQLIFVTGHPEYDAHTLSQEYHRDLILGLHPSLPDHYFPKNNSNLIPKITWRSHAHLLFNNWINYYVHRNSHNNLSKNFNNSNTSNNSV
ncbi:homoserine O-succinyltransferase [Candidatus Blochmanniella vafra str. BVAF]|uniref:Homoserine O-succinyltransferase n=1 Tax=Blochmanniella vafra (strain BVAF) TaxID=859654 RepID=E8Q7A6_BLOVB|nr:homoserine O-succinyltransferase [Candidatus Blochmannia vafer]ADV34001.1 homoserine O-succinyltransferase [Candidatus Blochmannia vafer str. BVAF]